MSKWNLKLYYTPDVKLGRLFVSGVSLEINAELAAQKELAQMTGHLGNHKDGFVPFEPITYLTAAEKGG